MFKTKIIEVEVEKPYERDRKSLKMSKYFDFRGSGMNHQDALEKAIRYVDEVMPKRKMK